MKKILQLNAFIMLLFSSILLFFNFKNNDSLQWMDWGHSNVSQDIYLRNTKYLGKDLYYMLTTLADEMQVNLVKTDYLMLDNQQTTIKSVYIQDDKDNMFESLHVIDGMILTKEDNMTNKFLSSKDSKEKDYTGKIFDFLDDDAIQVWTLTRFSNERGSLDGDYIVRSHDRNRIDAFVDELSVRSGIDKEKLVTQTTFRGLLESSVETISIIGIGISLFIFAILSIYYAVNSSKKIGIMKMNGFKNSTIWKELTISIFATLSITTLLLDIMFIFLVKNNSMYFMKNLFKVQLLVILVLLLTSSLIYIIIKRNTVSNLIKNKKQIKHVVWLSYILKCFAVFIFGALSLSIGYNLEMTKQEYDKMSVWDDVGELGVLVDVEIGEDIASIAQGDTKLDNDFAQYYDYLDDKGAIYADVKKFTPHVQFKTKFIEETGEYDYVDYFEPTLVDQNFSVYTYQINQNYLKNFPIYDMNGKQIEIQDTEERIILIPESMANKKRELEEIYKSDYIDSINSDLRRENKQFNEKIDVKITSIIYKENIDGYFSFSEDFKESNYKIYAPIFEVLTKKNMTLGEKSNIRVSGLESPLKLQFNMTSSEFNESIQTELAQLDLDDNNLKYMTIGEVFATQINTLKSLYRQYIIGLVITYIVIIFMTIHLTKLVIEANKKTYCVKKLYGHKFLDRFKRLLCIGAILNILALVAACMLTPQLVQLETTTLSIILITTYIILDTFVYIMCIRFFESKSVSQMVKGE